ncbi:hypothetical protein [Streptomyces profundus]|uniref:hypothetical protein n=1 Tax=Streptomyces profundus TaxID=2867410 RepID=UPI001D163671|nr:hypothetical protein [Streptomyces sp. MA3_2.13]UED85381.1 hypothetical protein K4G22_15225 [Streptomyces sp. MA3_2.13]
MRWNSPAVKSLLAVLALALLGTVGVMAYRAFFAEDTRCADGVSKKGPRDECVGVTDGSFNFMADSDEFTELSRLIREENRAVVDGEEDYVTLGFILPFTAGDEIQRGHMVNEVAGAYLAQHRANHDANSAVPKIRLALANTGQDSEQWEPVAAQLVEMAASDEDNLRAVVGFNVSTDETAAALDYLTGEGIPVVTGPLTAENLGHESDDGGEPHRAPNPARVVPDNDAQGRALRNGLPGISDLDIDLSKTHLVRDVRAGDRHLSSLTRVMGNLHGDQNRRVDTFSSPDDVNDTGSLTTDFERIITSLCHASDAEVIYFAGRNVQLRLFVNALGQHNCEREFTVITISGASTLTTDPELDVSALERVTVLYTTNAHPDTWLGNDGIGGSYEEFEDLEELVAEQELAGTVDLVDSRAITMYDAVAVAVEGIRVKGGEGIPELEDVTNTWRQMRGNLKLVGVSGWICLNADGHPGNKAVSIVQLVPALEGDEVEVRFLGLGWPDGAPPRADTCPDPNS